jgi:hypothetical protein
MMLSEVYEYETILTCLLVQLVEEHPKESFLLSIYLTRLNLAATSKDCQRVMQDLVETVLLMFPVGKVIQLSNEEGIQQMASSTMAQETAPLLGHYLGTLCENDCPVFRQGVIAEMKLLSKVLEPLREALIHADVLDAYADHWEWIKEITSYPSTEEQKDNESQQGDLKK